MDTQLDFGFEIQKSEYRKTKIFILVLVVALAVMIINGVFLTDTVVRFFDDTANYYLLGLWVLLFISHESFIFLFIRKKLRNKNNIGNKVRFIHLFIETMFPSILIFFLIKAEGKQAFLDSPVVYLYFIIIILSALNLNFKLSLATGFISFISYFAITYWAFNIIDYNKAFTPILPENIYYIKAVLFLVAGAAAGLVGEEIKNNVLSSFATLEQKMEVEKILGQQVSLEVSEQLLKEERTSESEHATILFFDIRDFTPMAEKKKPSEVIDFQNDLFDPVIRIINDHGGIINQFMGDGLMATFGVPIKNPDHSKKAVLASLEIIKKLQEMGEKDIIPPTRVGIGIHCGEIIAGNIGNEIRKQFSVSGKTVIVAARLEQLNKKYGSTILISADLQAEISELELITENLGSEVLKGIDNKMDIYKVA